jgi:hypothetical protein
MENWNFVKMTLLRYIDFKSQRIYAKSADAELMLELSTKKRDKNINFVLPPRIPEPTFKIL